jgi:hypothetical protein
LKRINLDYIQNSRKLLKLYPKQGMKALHNKEKNRGGESKLKDVYYNENENLESMIKKVFYKKFLKMKNRRKIQSILQGKSPNVPSRQISIVSNDVKIETATANSDESIEHVNTFSKFKVQNQTYNMKPKRVKSSTMISSRKRKNFAKLNWQTIKEIEHCQKYREKSTPKYKHLDITENNSEVSDRLHYTIESYHKTQKHKFLPAIVIKAIKGRKEMKSIEPTPRVKIMTKKAKRSKSSQINKVKNMTIKQRLRNPSLIEKSSRIEQGGNAACIHESCPFEFCLKIADNSVLTSSVGRNQELDQMSNDIQRHVAELPKCHHKKNRLYQLKITKKNKGRIYKCLFIDVKRLVNLSAYYLPKYVVKK